MREVKEPADKLEAAMPTGAGPSPTLQIAAQQAAVAQIGQTALGHGSFDSLLEEACQLVRRILDTELVDVLELAGDRETLRVVAGVGWRPDIVGQLEVKAGTGSLAGFTVASGNPVIMPDADSELRFAVADVLRANGIRSGISARIGGPDRPYGALAAFSTRHAAFTSDDAHFLQAVANVLAAAVERLRVEAELHDTRDQLAANPLPAVLGALDEAVFVFNRAGLLRLRNRAAEVLLDGEPTPTITALADRLGLEERQLLAAGDPLEFEFGNQRWLELRTHSAAPASPGDGGGQVVPSVVVLRDLTAQRAARAARDAFLGILSHELRTPITTIYGGSELLQRELNPDHRAEIIADIRIESERLARLVEDLLVMTRVEEGAVEVGVEPILIQRLVPSIVGSFRSHRPDVEVTMSFAGQLPAVAGDQTYIEQVVRNLLTNAVRYGEGQEHGIEVVARQEDAELVVRVLDRGPGFEHDDAARLFDLFYRAPSARIVPGGAGIGLFVCRHLIESMGGRMWARPRDDGRGAEFAFSLPVMEIE